RRLLWKPVHQRAKLQLQVERNTNFYELDFYIIHKCTNQGAKSIKVQVEAADPPSMHHPAPCLLK
ncbi:unnamed protein product, partial [Caenorhabditis brenneri]